MKDFKEKFFVLDLRTCNEMKSSGTTKSGYYWIDPDGQNFGEKPIYVYCDMGTGKRTNSISDPRP